MMKKVISYGSLAWLILFFIGPLMAKGNDGRPVTDSLPGSLKSTARLTDKPAADSIKTVPRARNQAVPIPITQQIKPIKLIKPIIRPVIKILH